MDESNLALARYLRVITITRMNQAAGAVLAAAGTMVLVELAIWLLTGDFPGRLLAFNAALFVAGGYLALATDRVPLPDQWAARTPTPAHSERRTE